MEQNEEDNVLRRSSKFSVFVDEEIKKRTEMASTFQAIRNVLKELIVNVYFLNIDINMIIIITD
jgi:hypothetical protein